MKCPGQPREAPVCDWYSGDVNASVSPAAKAVGGVTPLEEMVASVGALPRDTPDRASSVSSTSEFLPPSVHSREAREAREDQGEKVTHIDQVLGEEVSVPARPGFVPANVE